MPAIRQQINIAAPLRAVWTALTTSEGWCAFWADEARVEGREGGRIVLVGRGDDGAAVEERGIFHEFKPTRKLEIAWDTASTARTKGSRLEFTVSRDKDETRVALVHTGAAILGDAALEAALDKEWRTALKALREHLETPST